VQLIVEHPDVSYDIVEGAEYIRSSVIVPSSRFSLPPEFLK